MTRTRFTRLFALLPAACVVVAFVVAGAQPAVAQDDGRKAAEEAEKALESMREAARLARKAGPSAIPELKKLLGEAETPAERAIVENLLGEAIHTVVLEKIRSEIQPDGSFGFYEGQFSDLKPHGVAAARAALAIARDSNRSPDVRRLALEAVSDTGSEAVFADLYAIMEDETMEGGLRETAMYILARLGETGPVDRRITQVEEQLEANKDNPQAVLQLNSVLSNMYYRIRNYPKAVEAYQAQAEILEQAKQQNPDNEQLLQRLNLAYYNMACSMSLAGNTEGAANALEKAIQNGYDSWQWIKADGDLANLRASDHYRKLALKYDPEKKDPSKRPRLDF